MYHHTWGFGFGLVLLLLFILCALSTWALVLSRQMLYQLHHLPSPCIWAQCYLVSILKVNLIVGANQIFPEWIENEECALSCLLKSQEIFPEVQSPRVPVIAKGDGVNQHTSLKFLSFSPSVKTYRSEARWKCPCCGKDPISQWFDFPLCTGKRFCWDRAAFHT